MANTELKAMQYGVSPLCKVIVGFKNFTRHLTRSQYISFAIEEQPEMCRLLLLFASKKITDKILDQFPPYLIEQLIDYGFLKRISTMSFKEKFRAAFNLLNENRYRRIIFRGKKYAITSFVFMAFYSQKEGEFLRESAILPYWCRQLSRVTFDILTQGLDSGRFRSFSRSLRKKLIKHGLICSLEKQPNWQVFFKEECELSLALIAELPDFYQQQLAKSDLHRSSYKINSEIYWQLAEVPVELHRYLLQGEWIERSKPSIWVFHPVRKILSAYWLSEAQQKSLQDLQRHRITLEDLNEDTFRLFVYSDILQNPTVQAEAQILWEKTVKELREELTYDRGIILESILLPLELAMARKYLRYRLEKKWLLPDRANGSTRQRFWVHRDEFTFYLQGQVTGILSQVLTEPVKVGHNALTIYTPGAVLPKHQDDVLAFSWVLSLAIQTLPEQSREGAWPIYVETPKEEVNAVYLQAGDGVLINPQMPHWRDELLGHSLNILFMWFIPQSFRGYVNGSWID